MDGGSVCFVGYDGEGGEGLRSSSKFGTTEYKPVSGRRRMSTSLFGSIVGSLSQNTDLSRSKEVIFLNCLPVELLFIRNHYRHIFRHQHPESFYFVPGFIKIRRTQRNTRV